MGVISAWAWNLASREPGASSGKIWVDRVNAFAPAVKFDDGGTAILQLDYLWHNFDIIHMKDTDGEMPLYIGLGGDLVLAKHS